MIKMSLKKNKQEQAKYFILVNHQVTCELLSHKNKFQPQ